MTAVSKIFHDIMKMVSAGGVQFAITLITTPLMTRLYDPSAYAVFGIIHAMAVTGIGVGLLSLPNAYTLERDHVRRSELMHMMALLLGALVFLAMLAAIVMAAVDFFHSGLLVPALFPVLVLTFGLRQILVSRATARTDFSSLALSQIIEPSCSRGGSIALGAALGGHPAFILGSVALGHLATAALAAKISLRELRTACRILLRTRINTVAVLRRYGDFVIFNTASQQAQPLALLGIQMAIAAFFSTQIAGYYIFAISILTLPVSLIALTTAPVVYRHFIEIERMDRTALAGRLRRSLFLYILAGTTTMLPVFLFGETIFSVAFGKIWAPAGAVAATLSVAYVSAFALTGVQSIFRVTHRLRLQFMLESLTCLLALGAAALCFKTMDFNTAIPYLSAIWFFRNSVLLSACVVVAAQHADESL